ncbi:MULTISPECIES: DUF2125 domain-containing protein [unclassified Yoonia]|uniref:DUF2125 domain-containing protein n=1 Tax=unclassified Yoonia TaxID=2629118 RepID=UPI002AFE49C8|nr:MULTISPECIES: DUF2125 domain-containing protein [unclassified Yoonia]
MYRLVVTLIWAVLLFSGYWFAASQVLLSGPDRAAGVLARDGVDLRYGSVATTGFPARFEMAVTDVELAHADWTWRGARLDVQADSLRPLAVNVTLPQEQTLRFAGQTLRVTSEDWQAEASVRPTARLSFDSGSLRMGRTEVMSDDGWQLALRRLDATLDLVGDQGARYDARIVAEDIALPDVLRDRIDPQGLLGAQVASLSGAGRMTLSRPLDRNLQGRFPDVDRLALEDLRIAWGPVTAQMAGEIAVDAAGIPTGQITLQTRQWKAVVDLLIAADVIDAGIAETVTRLAGFMADADGMLTIPVAFQDGVTLVGLVPVGPAPRLR